MTTALAFGCSLLAIGAIYALTLIHRAHRSRMRRDIGFLTKPHVDHDPSEYATNWERDR